MCGSDEDHLLIDRDFQSVRRTKLHIAVLAGFGGYPLTFFFARRNVDIVCGDEDIRVVERIKNDERFNVVGSFHVLTPVVFSKGLYKNNITNLVKVNV